MAGVAAYSSPRPLAAAPRAGNLPVAVLVALGALLVAASAALVTVAFVALLAGHRGVELGRQPLLMGAGFSCAYAAAVVGIWRGGRLHPAAVFAVWALGLCVVVPGAAFPGAAVAVLGGAVAVALGSSPPLWRDRRLIVALALGALVLCAAASALSPAAHPAGGHVHASRPAAAKPAAVSPPAATPAPVSPPVATPTAVAPPVAAPTRVSPRVATATRVSPPVATPTPVSPPAAGSVTATPVSPAATQRATQPEASPTAGGAVAPLPPVAPETAAAATSIVRDFYAALDARRFAAAWAMLPPTLHTSFGGFAHWRAGYRTTLASRPERISVTATAAGGLVVRHVLVAIDRRRCGAETRRYAVTWRLERRRASWGVVSLGATALGPASASCR